MIWIDKRMHTTAEWVVWFQEFRDQVCPRGFGSEEQKRPLCDTKCEIFRHNLWFHDLLQMRLLQLDHHFTAVFCLPTLNHLF